MFNFLVVFLFGLALGSFSNVCIYRVPLNLSVATPRRSFCPWCNHQIQWHQNIPVLSFILQRARCAFCKSLISSRYLFVELLLPILGLTFLTIKSSTLYVDFLFIGLTLFFAIAISFIDLDWRIIPDTLSMPWLVATFLFAPFNPVMASLGWEQSYAQSVFGAAAAAFVVWVTLFLGRIIKNRDVMGWGDVKLMACWGAVLGGVHGTVVFFVAAALATVWIVVCFVFKKLRSNEFLPFGPFINIAGVLLLWMHLVVWKDVPSFVTK